MGFGSFSVDTLSKGPMTINDKQKILNDQRTQLVGNRSLHTILAIGILLRLFAAVNAYSGYNKAPNYGDFEAQRHWMEITTALPVSQWYFFDSSWWPLDYPPLTAYHSWLLGKVGAAFKPAWFELDVSRGYENFWLTVFMRCTVFASEALVFVPAVYICIRQLQKLSTSKPDEHQAQNALLALLTLPPLIMIDHGHFQYNVVMLGLFMAAVASFLVDRHLLGCVFFVAALGFKQMALFYAPAVAAYLAGTCFMPKLRLLRFLGIAMVTLISVALLYLPLLVGTACDLSRGIDAVFLSTVEDQLPFESGFFASGITPYAFQVAQSLHRIFPFSRGLFEDKVANIWCTIQYSGLYKLTVHHSPQTLSLAALAVTAFAGLPPCIIIFLRPRKDLILLAFTTSAWAFFLCSYQVHEKNVLLPLVPMTAILAGPRSSYAATKAWVGFATILSTWTLYHLLIKDNLEILYLPLLGVWNYLLEMPPFSLGPYRVPSSDDGPSQFTKYTHLCFYGAIVAWHVLERLVPPPASKPDLWTVMNTSIGCLGFVLCYSWCLLSLWRNSGLQADICAALKQRRLDRSFGAKTSDYQHRS